MQGLEAGAMLSAKYAGVAITVAGIHHGIQSRGCSRAFEFWERIPHFLSKAKFEKVEQ